MTKHKKTKIEAPKWSQTLKPAYTANCKYDNLYLEFSVWSEESDLGRGRRDWYLSIAPMYSSAFKITFSIFRTRRDAFAYVKRMLPHILAYFRALSFTQLEASAPFAEDEQKSGIHLNWQW